MPDDVNFVDGERKKKSPSEQTPIEYTQGEEVRSGSPAVSFADVQEVVEKTTSSFAEWRAQRKRKKEAAAARERAQAEQRAREQALRAQQRTQEHAVQASPRSHQATKPVFVPSSAPTVEHRSVKQRESHGQAPAVDIIKAQPVSAEVPKKQQHDHSVPEIKAPVAQRAQQPVRISEETGRSSIQGMTEPDESLEPIESVNLIPDSVFEDMRAQHRVRDLLVATGLMAAVLMMAYTGFTVYAQRLDADTHDVIQRITELDARIAEKESQRVIAQEQFDQLEAVQSIVQNHIQWTPVFEYIEHWTLPSVYYSSMTGSALTGDFTFSAYTNDIRFVTAQVEILRNSPQVRAVSTTSATQSVSEPDEAGAAPRTVVSFTLTVKFDPSLFRQVVE